MRVPLPPGGHRHSVTAPRGGYGHGGNATGHWHAIGQETLENALRSAFDTLLAELRTTLVPTIPPDGTTEPPPDGTDETSASAESTGDAILDPSAASELAAVTASTETDDTDPSETDYQDGSTVDLETAIASLTQNFEEALARLLESADTASHLPPLSSPPSGQGKAYDKFLAIYEGLLQGGAEPPTDPPTDSPDDAPIDVIV